MKRSILVMVIGLCAWTVCAKDKNEFVQSTVAIHVVDSNGAPITNADVAVNSYTLSKMLDGVTDTNGVFVYTDRVGGEIGCYVHKEGYYATHGGLWSGPHKFTDHPDGTYSIVLKNIVAPTPLLFHQIQSIKIPVLDESIPFDLEIGDWVKPYGTGSHQDVWITGVFRRAARRDFDIKVTMAFSNALDGIQVFWAPTPESSDLCSDLMPPQVAPKTGYTASLIASVCMRPVTLGVESWTWNRNFCFRVRTTTNGANEIVAANVGWTRRDIKVGVNDSDQIALSFSYYFNPNTNSQSLEPIDADNKSRRRHKP